VLKDHANPLGPDARQFPCPPTPEKFTARHPENPPAVRRAPASWMQRSRVDLPDPDGPSRQTVSPTLKLDFVERHASCQLLRLVATSLELPGEAAHENAQSIPPTTFLSR
jgi:hypothetical protein